jgi:hypothetical protein
MGIDGRGEMELMLWQMGGGGVGVGRGKEVVVVGREGHLQRCGRS